MLNCFMYCVVFSVLAAIIQDGPSKMLCGLIWHFDVAQNQPLCVPQ